MKIISFSIRLINLLYLLIIAIVFFSKKRVDNKETKVFSYILIANVIGLILEIVNYSLLINSDRTNIFYIFETKMILVYYFVWGSLFIGYELILFKKDTKYIKIFTIITSLILLFIKIDFKDVGEFIIPQGLVPNFVYFISTIYVFICIYLTIKNYQKERIKKYIPLIVLIILLGATIYVQYIMPELLLTTFAESIVVFIMYFTIENPDVKMLEEMTILRDRADKANNAKSEFLSSMSHEIRTPLNAIVGFSESLKEDNLSEESMEKVEDIVMASNNLLEIVNGILDISKIEANKLEIVEKEYEIEELWNELIILTKARIGDRGIDFRVNIDPTIPKVLYGDNTRLKQVILNILTNAAKYTKEGFVDFRVSSVIKNNIVKLIISVEDSGIGIKEENLPRLFSKFDRLSVEKSITIEGTGLGLAITKKLVELMGGKIVVQSVYGKGSKFTIFVEQKIVSYEVQHQKETTESNTKVVDIKGSKLLLVDDNELNIKVASTLLKKYDLDIDSCTSGFDCLEKINKGSQYDIILLDDMMPKMSGKETLTKLKQINGFNIPVIALTANAIEGMKEEYLKAGFNDYLSKPIEKKELERVLRTYLAKREINNTNTVNMEKTISLMPEDIVSNLDNDKIVMNHNLESKPVAEIPKEKVENTTPKQVLDMELPSLKKEESAQKGKVLIVDDNSLNIKVAERLISKYVSTVDCVNSGSECIAKIIEDDSYDLILMDDMMPELDGPTTMDNLRDIEGFNIPVYLLTASDYDSTIEEKIGQHHFAGYLAKPINKEELTKVLTKYIK